MLSGFSGQVVFERWSIGLYNVVSCIYVYFTLFLLECVVEVVKCNCMWS